MGPKVGRKKANGEIKKKMLFIYFSSAYNTTMTPLLGPKMKALWTKHHTVAQAIWLSQQQFKNGYASFTPQSVHLRHVHGLVQNACYRLDHVHCARIQRGALQAAALSPCWNRSSAFKHATCDLQRFKQELIVAGAVRCLEWDAHLHCKRKYHEHKQRLWTAKAQITV